MEQDEISHCVKIALAMAEITPHTFARIMCVSNVTAYSYIQGKIPTISKLSEVAAACSIDYHEFVQLSKKAKITTGKANNEDF